MRIGAYDRLAQLQFFTSRSSHKKYLNGNSIKNILISSEKKNNRKNINNLICMKS